MRTDLSAIEPAAASRNARQDRLLVRVLGSEFFFPLLSFLVVSILVYWRFLFGDGTLLYKDVGSDSLNSYYPDFVNLSRYIRNEGFPSWSFYVGMGQDLAYATGYLIWQPVSWLPKELIAPALVFQHLAKTLVTGFFFFRFLQLRSLAAPAALLGALLLSFSAYMCMGSCWYPLTDEVVCFAGILFATERALQFGRWLMLVLMIALVGMINPFFLYLCALLLCIYVPLAPLSCDRSLWPRRKTHYYFVLAVIFALGVGLGAIVTLPYLKAVLNSPRGSGTVSASKTLGEFPIFGFAPARHYVTAVLRAFSNDMTGAAKNFHGWRNYLEAPLPYCGLFCLVILPQVFVRASRTRRLLYIGLLVGILIPVIFPWFRYAFWAFQGDYYRTFSLFSILAVIILSMIAFSRYLKERTLNLWLLGATVFVQITILLLPIHEWQTQIDSFLKVVVVILITLFGALLAAGQLLNKQSLAAYFIIGLATVELVSFDRLTVANRDVVTKDELKQRVGYNDETIDLVRDITTRDNDFFRLTKLRPSTPSIFPSLNDAMMYGYYGTSSYSSFNSVNYTNFLTFVGAMPPNSESETRWAVGLADSAVLSAFACEKYLLVDDPTHYWTDTYYEAVQPSGKNYLFRNHLFLPLGVTFHRYIDKESFRQLPSREKQEALFRAVVLSGVGPTEVNGLSKLTIPELEDDISKTPLLDVVTERRNGALELNTFRQTQIAGTVNLGQQSIIVFQTPFDEGWHAVQDGQAVPIQNVDAGLLGVNLNAGHHNLELKYRNPALVPALSISLVSLLLVIAGLKRWPRLGLSERAR